MNEKNIEEEVISFKDKFLSNVGEIEPPSDFTGKIMEAVAAERIREKRRFHRISIIIAATAGAAAILLIAFLPAFMLQDTHTGTTCQTESLSATSKSEQAADWLVSQQSEDGSWSPSQTGGNEAFRPALTALALMALQRHAPIRHADAILRAEKALESMQTADGSFSDSPSSKLYNHAFATFALLCLQNDRETELTPTIKRAITFSLRNQNHLGAWDYTINEPGNTALTVWQLGLLLRAQKAGWNDQNGQLRRGLAWLKKQGHNGMFDYRAAFDQQYTPYSGNITLTAMATSTILEAAKTFPQLQKTADNAAESLRMAYSRSEQRETSKAMNVQPGNGGTIYTTVIAMLDKGGH